MFCSILEQYALKWGKRSAIGTIPAQRLFSLKSINLPKQLSEFHRWRGMMEKRTMQTVVHLDWDIREAAVDDKYS